jgi:hypothetical protein
MLLLLLWRRWPLLLMQGLWVLLLVLVVPLSWGSVTTVAAGCVAVPCLGRCVGLYPSTLLLLLLLLGAGLRVALHTVAAVGLWCVPLATTASTTLGLWCKALTTITATTTRTVSPIRLATT